MADIFVEDRQQIFWIDFALLFSYQTRSNLTILKHFIQRLKYNVCYFSVKRNAHQRVQYIDFLNDSNILSRKRKFVLVDFSQEKGKSSTCNHLNRQRHTFPQAIQTRQGQLCEQRLVLDRDDLSEPC